MHLNVNDPASGSLKITGDRTEGKTLTADTSGIEDKDGLPAGFNDYIDASLDDDCIGLSQSLLSSGNFLINGEKHLAVQYLTIPRR